MTEPHAHVLVVDDDRQIRSALETMLKARNYQVSVAESGEQALAAAGQSPPDLVVLDLSLPGMDGMAVCRELRTWLKAPILVLSVRADAAEKIQALDLGADDYMCKPFVAGELLARVRALLRRTGDAPPATEPVQQVGDLAIDFARRRVRRGDEEIHLTRKEFEILSLLVRNRDRVITSRNILAQVWGPEYADDVMTLRVHIGNLRKKVERGSKRLISTEPGVGYMLVSQP